MTIIEVRTSRGIVGRCDASCYNAEGTDCHCICGGANHGVGVGIAMEDRRYLSDAEVLAACDGLKSGERAAVYKPQIQKRLWDNPEPVCKKSLDSRTAGR